MNTEHKVIPTTELVGALMTNQLGDDARKQLKEDPQAFILSHTNVQVNNEIAIVENSANSVALALPYYESLEAISSEGVADADLDNVAGGEILITIFIAIGGAIGLGVGSALATAGVFGTATAVATGVAVSIGTGAAVGGVVGAGAVAGIGVGAAHATGKLK